MLNNKICVSKRLLFIFLLAIMFFYAYIFVSNTFSSSKKTLSSKAAPHEIIGGRDAQPGEFPFIAYISSGCTGVLIDPEWVLTAAHCINRMVDGYLSVAINIVNLKEAQSNYIKAYPIRHNEYNPSGFINDIALLRLQKKVTDVIPASLPSSNWKEVSNYMYHSGTDTTVVGWGCVGISPTPGATINPDYDNPNYDVKYIEELQVITLPIPLSDPFKIPKKFAIGYIDDNSMQKTTCWRDSGGPVLYGIDHPNIVIGINSTSWSGLRVGPSMAVKISDYLSWIQGTMKDPPLLSTPPTPSPTPTPPTSCIDQNNNGLSVPIISSLDSPVVNSDIFVYQDCVYDVKTKEKTGLVCYHNLPYYGTPHAILPAYTPDNCYVPFLSDCLHYALSGNGVPVCHTVDPSNNSQLSVEYRKTYIDAHQRTYTCQCTNKSRYPVLVEK